MQNKHEEMYLICKQLKIRYMEMFNEEKIVPYGEGAMSELKHAAFEVLLLNPGLDREGWIVELMKHYPCEVADMYGTDEVEVHDGLAGLWSEDYADSNSGLRYSFSRWSQALITEESVKMYYDLIEVRCNG